jgi:putative drug exporter of the RND superfamily
MFDRLGRLVLRARVPIVIAWFALAIVALTMVPSLAALTASQDAGFLPAGSPSRLAAERLAAAFPDEHAGATATIVFTRPGATLGRSDREAVVGVAEWLRGPDVPPALADVLVSVEGAADVPGYAAMYRSEDGALELLSVRLDVDPLGDAAREAVAALRTRLVTLEAAGLQADVTGTAAISSDYLAAVIDGTDRTTLVTVVLVIVILLLIYRAPVAAMVPLVTIGAAFAVARAVLALLAQAGWQIPSLLDTFIVVLIFGIGTDYAIFLLSRYREELGRASRDRAAAVTVGRIGAVITASAAAVIVGLASMAAGSFGMIQTIGPALAISVAVTLAAGLTLTPALAMLCGRWLYWPRHDAVVAGTVHGPGAWDRLAAFIVRRPGRVASAVLVALTVPLLALPALRMEFDTIKELPATAGARRGFDEVVAHFDHGQLLPISVLVEAAAGVDLGSPGGLAELARWSRALAELDGVRAVRSLVTPTGDGTIPEGFRPSARLDAMTAGLVADADPMAALAALAEPATLEGLDMALAYVDALAAGYPGLAVEDAFVAVRADLGALRDAVAAYQAAGEGAAGRQAALTTAMQVGPRLPAEIGRLAESFRARPDDLFVPRGLTEADPAIARLLRSYLSPDGSASHLAVIGADDPYDDASFATVGRVRALLDERVAATAGDGDPLLARASVGGATATSADIQAATTADFTLVGFITIVGIFVVLAVLLRSLVAPMYLVGSVLLSFGTTLGIVTLLFQGVLGHDGVNYLVPLIVFVLLVAIGSDYNIFLIGRVREESAGRDLRTGIRVATARTGTVITSAGIILAGTFVALTVAPLQILVQVGLAVAIGVLIDTFVVRSLLIPALTALVGERAWWPSVRRGAVEGTTPSPRAIS